MSTTSCKVPSSSHDLVIIPYSSLLLDPEEAAPILQPSFQRAFGCKTHDTKHTPTAPLGLIGISGIPDFIHSRRQLFTRVHTLATLPSNYLETQLTHAPSKYNVGWSRNKERLSANKPTNDKKGSFYFNPLTDTPGTVEEREKYPMSYMENIWPEETVVPGFKECAMTLGCVMKDVVALMARHVDVFVNHSLLVDKDQKHTNDNKWKLHMGYEMTHTEKIKGRILYYFPHKKEDSGASAPTWIDWHNDSGFFTALAGDAYVNHDTGEFVPSHLVDPNAGLFVYDRNGTVHKVHIPEECMAIQIGECLQIATGGRLVATPHCVRGVNPSYNNSNSRIMEDSSVEMCDSHSDNDKVTQESTIRVARISFPCFVDTSPSFALRVPEGVSREQVLEQDVTNGVVPGLQYRWVKDGMEFGEFLTKTFETYYDWSSLK